MTIEPQLRGRLSSSNRWECIHFLPADNELDLDELEADGYFVAAIAGDAVRTDASLFEALSRALMFPDYFGANWDALDEVLTDLQWIAPQKVVLAIGTGTETNLNRTFGRLVEAWLSAAQEWSKSGVPFHLVVNTSSMSP